MNYIQRRLNSFYDIVLDNVSVGIATAFYHYRITEYPFKEMLEVNILFHNGFESFKNVKLTERNWRHLYEEEIVNQENLQAKELISFAIN